MEPGPHPELSIILRDAISPIAIVVSLRLFLMSLTLHLTATCVKDLLHHDIHLHGYCNRRHGRTRHLRIRILLVSLGSNTTIYTG